MKSKLVDIAAENLEQFIDIVIDDEIIKNIPLLSTFVNLARAAGSVRDNLFLNKVKSFIEGLEGASDGEKKKMYNELNCEKGQSRIGQALIFSLEQADQLEKAQLMGLCFKAYLEYRITKDELLKLWHAINKSYLDELLLLPLFETPKEEYGSLGWRLLPLGLVERAGQRSLRGALGPNGGWHETSLFNLTNLGRKFLKEIDLSSFSTSTQHIDANSP